MDFSAQALPTVAHDDVGKVAIPNVAVDRAFTNTQNFCGFLDCKQPLIIIRSDRQFFSPKMKSRPTGTARLVCKLDRRFIGWL
jgi:hypothetical protein